MAVSQLPARFAVVASTVRRQAGWYSPSLLSRLLSRSCGGFCQAWPRRDGEDGRDQPSVFFGICARLLPNDVRATVEQSLPGNLSMDDWQTMKEVIEAVRQAIPDAPNRPAGAVLEHVLSALKASDAKVLNCPKKDR